MAQDLVVCEHRGRGPGNWLWLLDPVYRSFYRWCRAPSLWEFDVLLCIDAPKDEPFFALHNSLSDSTKWIRQPITSSPVGGGFAMQPFFFWHGKSSWGSILSENIGGSCLGPQFSKTRDGSSKLCKVVDWSFASCPSCPSSWSRCDLWAPLMCSFSIMSMDSKYMWQRKWTSLEVYLDIPESIDMLFACKFEDSLIEFSLSPTELNVRGHSQSPWRILQGSLINSTALRTALGRCIVARTGVVRL